MIKFLMTVFAVVMIAGSATAYPEILDIFNSKYNARGTVLDTCETCHIKDKPPTFSEIFRPNKSPKDSQNYESNLNPYGASLKNTLNIEIPQALSKIENLDSDQDKFSNIDEIKNLTFPGDIRDFPKKNKFKNNLITELLNISSIIFHR